MIDQIDKQILEILTTDARAASKDIADVCGISRAAVHQRVERMKRDGVIIGSGFQVAPESLGYETSTFIGVTLSQGTFFDSAVESLKKIPEVVECHFTTGAYSIFVRLYCRNNTDLKRLLDMINQIEGVRSTETLISLQQSFCRTIPISLSQAHEPKRRRCCKSNTSTDGCDQE